MQVNRTEFGRANSVYRRDANLKLRQVAEYLGVTPAFLTNVEVGRKPVPEDWYARLTELYKLDVLQASLLRRAGLKSQKRFVIEPQSEKESELLAAFVEYRSQLDDRQLELAIDDLTVRDREVKSNERLSEEESQLSPQDCGDSARE